ncbi:MAG: alpha/beta hydrolase-fold protein [Chitinophagaceae bacterium]
MKKQFIVLSVMLLFPALLYCQSIVTKKIFSTHVNDSIPIKIWLPKNYSKSERYPTIYEFIYDHSNYIAATASNMWDVPNSIVVFAKIEGGNEDYKSPNLTDKGEKYYAFVKNELISYVSKEYNTTNYRIAAGLSQGADYINYILRNDPSLFSSYLIFSTEYPINYTPDFSSYTAKIKDSLSYYIAIANDVKERIKFANQLYDSLKTSPYLKIKKENFPNASHSYSILYALPDALLFAFEDYNTIRQKLPNESLISYYTSRLKEKKEKFGNVNYHSFVMQIFQSSDTEKEGINEINSFLDIVYSTKESMDIDFVNLGYVLRTKKFYQNAKKAYQMALLKKQETGITAMDNLTVYFQLYKAYDLDGKTGEALKTLQEGYEKTKEKDEGLLYTIGYYYIDKKIDIKKGIEILKSMLNDKHLVSGFWSKPKDEVYSKIATGYWELKNKKEAKIFVDKALEVKPKNEASLKLKALMK